MHLLCVLCVCVCCVCVFCMCVCCVCCVCACVVCAVCVVCAGVCVHVLYVSGVVCTCVLCVCVCCVCVFNHSNGMYLYLIIVLIFNFVVTNHVEHFFHVLICYLYGFFWNFDSFWQCQAAFRIPVPRPGIEPGSRQWKPRIAPSRPGANSPWSFSTGCVCSNYFPMDRLGSFLITNVLRLLCIFCVRFLCERCFYKHFLPVHDLSFRLLGPMQRSLSFQ